MEFGAAPVHRPGRLKAMPAFVPPDVEGAAAAAEYMLEAVEAAEAAESPIAQRLRLKLGECDAALGAETSRWDFAPRRRVAAIDYDDGTSAPRIRFGRAQHSPREGIMDWGCSPISAGNAGKAKYEAGISKPKMLSPRGPSSPNREGRSPRGPSSPARDGRGMNAAQLLESQRLKRRTRAAEAVLQQALPPKTAPASDWGFEVRWDTAVLDREGEEGRSCLSRAGLITRAEWRRRQPVGIVPAHSEAEKRAETRAHSDATPRGGHAATPGAVYTLNCGVISAVPEPTIVALLDDWSDTIDLSNYGIGDRLMAWVFAEPLAMKNATQLDLSGNRLGWRGADKVAKALIAAPHCRLAVLDLSQNALAASSPKNVHALVDLVTARARPTLQRLKLHNCGMGSAALATLFRGWSVGESPKRLPRAPSSVGGAALRRLDLSRNCLHIEAASLLESLLEPGGGLCGLRSLSLSWTQLRGAAAMAVGRGAGSSTSLQTLDLSWNALGSREGTSEAASFVATSVLASTSLTHLDVSFNRLSKGDLVFFSKSLKDNHTLVGLHVGGNDVPVRQDADGFFVAEDAPGKVKQSKEVSQGLQSAHVFTRILEKRHQATCASGQWAAGSGCWVCDKWSEVLFRYLPTTPAPAKVFVRCAFDAWQLAPLELVNGAFERWRMVPPGNQQFCYTVVAADGAELDVTVRESARAPVSFALPTTMGTRLAIGMAEPPQTVNVLHVCIREDDCGLDFFVPRRPGEKAAVATKARWSVATSVFAAYAADTTQSLTSVFEFDYACISKQKLFGGAHVEAEAKAALRACHDDLTTVFRLHCVLSKEVHTVGWNSWTAFVDDCFKQSTASALNRADVDMAILAESDLALRPSCRPLTGVRFLLAGVRSLLTGVRFLLARRPGLSASPFID